MLVNACRVKPNKQSWVCTASSRVDLTFPFRSSTNTAEADISLGPAGAQHATVRRAQSLKSDSSLHWLQFPFISPKLEAFISLRWSWIPPCLFPEGAVTSPHAGETFTSSPGEREGGGWRMVCCSLFALEGATGTRIMAGSNSDCMTAAQWGADQRELQCTAIKMETCCTASVQQKSSSQQGYFSTTWNGKKSRKMTFLLTVFIDACLCLGILMSFSDHGCVGVQKINSEIRTKATFNQILESGDTTVILNASCTNTWVISSSLFTASNTEQVIRLEIWPLCTFFIPVKDLVKSFYLLES